MFLMYFIDLDMLKYTMIRVVPIKPLELKSMGNK